MGKVVIISGEEKEVYDNIHSVDFIEGLLTFTEVGKQRPTRCYTMVSSNSNPLDEDNTRVKVKTANGETIKIVQLEVGNCAKVHGVVERVEIQNSLYVNGSIRKYRVSNHAENHSKEAWKLDTCSRGFKQKKKGYDLKVVISGDFRNVRIVPPYEVAINFKRAVIENAQVGNCLKVVGEVYNATVGNCLEIYQ